MPLDEKASFDVSFNKDEIDQLSGAESPQIDYGNLLSFDEQIGRFDFGSSLNDSFSLDSSQFELHSHSGL